MGGLLGVGLRGRLRLGTLKAPVEKNTSRRDEMLLLMSHPRKCDSGRNETRLFKRGGGLSPKFLSFMTLYPTHLADILQKNVPKSTSHGFTVTVVEN